MQKIILLFAASMAVCLSSAVRAGSSDLDASLQFSNVRLRESVAGSILTGVVRLPRGMAPSVAAHVDVTVGAWAETFQSNALSVTHPRLPHSRKQQFLVELPAGVPPDGIRLVYHAGVH